MLKFASTDKALLASLIQLPILLGVLVHGGIRAVQGGRPGKGLRSRSAVKLRRTPACHIRQTGASALRARPHCSSTLSGPGISAYLLCGGEFRGRQGQIQVIPRINRMINCNNGELHETQLE